VLVCNDEGETIGIVVERILDIVEDRADVQSPQAGREFYIPSLSRTCYRTPGIPPSSVSPSRIAAYRPNCGGFQLSYGTTTPVLHVLSRQIPVGVELQKVQEVMRYLK